MAEPLKAYAVEPYSYSEARVLADQLGVSEPVAITLVRRGYRTPEEARHFLAADETHSAEEFDSMGEITGLLRSAIEAGRRITVHGDFDVDGVCATAVAVAALRDLGADCDWFIPDRLADGYGLGEAGLEALAGRGTSLILTVDCAVTAVEQVRRAAELGIEVIVTDHHQPGPELPDCPILHPAVAGYPFGDLCGTAVAWKLTESLRASAGQDPEIAERDLDLVALATVADVVPLVGENRSLVRRGLEVARRAARPGMRALIAAAGCEPSRVDEGDLAFRLGPRINAAGRLYRADAGVELFLTCDLPRAEEIATELDRANHERREIERSVDAAAEAALREFPEPQRDAAAIVLADRGWHPGVIGIVASRLAERHLRPAVLISLDREGSGRGSGRSVPGFDLLEALRACSSHLERFGGHRAAAGLEVREEEVPAFRDAFIAAAEAVLGSEHAAAPERIDAVVGGERIGLELAEELERLGPFGSGNPSVSLLVPSARVRDVQKMGEGRHSRFNLHSGAHRARTVAFGRAGVRVGAEEPVDAAVRLELNHWNGSIEPRLVLRELYRLDGGGEEDEDPGRHICAEPGPGEWWERLEAEAEADPEEWVPGSLEGAVGERQVVRRSGSPGAIVAELVSSGESVLALTADASRRAGLAEGAAGLARFAGGAPQVACGRCAMEEIGALAAAGQDGLTVSDFAALELAPRMPASYAHVVLVDPPPFPHLMAAAGRTDPSGGFLHPVWGEPEEQLAGAVLEEQLGLRWPLSSLYRDLRTAPADDEALRAALRGSARHPRSAELAGRCLRVLLELGLARLQREGGVRRLGVVSSGGTELEHSAAFRAYGARRREGTRYLESLKHR